MSQSTSAVVSRASHVHQIPQTGFAQIGPVTSPMVVNRTPISVDDYLTHRAFVSYDFKNGLVAQLNVSNFTDEDYYTGVRNNVSAATGIVTGGWATPGDARSAVFSLFYNF